MNNNKKWYFAFVFFYWWWVASCCYWYTLQSIIIIITDYLWEQIGRSSEFSILNLIILWKRNFIFTKRKNFKKNKQSFIHFYYCCKCMRISNKKIVFRYHFLFSSSIKPHFIYSLTLFDFRFSCARLRFRKKSIFVLWLKQILQIAKQKWKQSLLKSNLDHFPCNWHTILVF